MSMRLRRDVICVVLSLVFICMCGLTACNTDEDKVVLPDGFVAVDLQLADYEEQAIVSRSGELKDTSNGSFILLKKFDEADVSVYYYEEYKETMGIEIHMTYIVLERAGVYNAFFLEMYNNNVMNEGASAFECYDYDGDGEEEIAFTFVTAEREMYKDQDLYIFDYNSISDSYDMYSMNMYNFRNKAEEAVLKFYKEHYGIEYEPESSTNNLRRYRCIDENYMQFGNCMDISLKDNGDIKVALNVYEALDGNLTSEDIYSYDIMSTSTGRYNYTDEEMILIEEFTYTETGYVNCDVKYMGDGKFVMNMSEYIEDTSKRS